MRIYENAIQVDDRTRAHASRFLSLLELWFCRRFRGYHRKWYGNLIDQLYMDWRLLIFASIGDERINGSIVQCLCLLA